MSQREWRSSTQIIEAAVDILRNENPMTIRQLFYRLVSAHVIENQVRDYHQIIRLMTKARQDRRVDYDWIVDRSRACYKSHVWGNMGELANAFEAELLRYRSDWWETQPKYVEIWCEKDTVTGSIEEVRDEYGVRVDANRGFNSTSNMHAAAVRLLKEDDDRDKRVHILYLGDWDPSGEDMERDLRDRLDEAAGGRLDFVLTRVAIKRSDISRYDLPPLRVKDTDSRTKGFVLKHGEDCVELDALPPNELRARLRTCLSELINKEAWERAKLVEEAQRETNRSVAQTIKQMMVAA